MDFTSEEFQQSDEIWLAEKIFSQLKEFGSEIDIGNDLFENFETNKDLILDLSRTDPNNTERNKEQSTSVSNSQRSQEKDIKTDTTNVPDSTFNSCNNFEFDFSANAAQNNFPNSNELKNPPNLNFTQAQNVNDAIILVNEPTAFLQQGIPATNQVAFQSQVEMPSLVASSLIIKCMNCDKMFDENAFMQHICDYDSNKQLIVMDKNENLPSKNFIKQKKISLEKEFFKDPPCIRILRENNARIRKFLKDELKIDLAGQTTKKDGPHECTLCERKFVHASGLARHMEKHAMDLIPSTSINENKTKLRVVVKCLICGRIFFAAKNALKHLFENHQKKENVKPRDLNNDSNENADSSDDEIETPSAGMMQAAIKFFDKKLTDEPNIEEKEKNQLLNKQNKYLKIVILNSVLQCEFCDYMFSDVANLLLHSCTHNPLRGFECFECEIYVNTSKEIFLHWQAECPFVREHLRNNLNLQKYYVCNVCENKFTTLEQLFEHRYCSLHLFPRFNRTLSIMQICCEYCETVFDSAAEIIRHHDEKHLKKIPKKEASIAAIASTTSALKYRQYLCDVCGKSYTQSSHLWQHLRFHRGVKPFACKELGCNRRFTIRPDLNDHIRKCHTGERPYHCLVCGKRFLTGSVFYQHRLIHRGERRYGCEECGKRFYRADALKNHQRIHTGEKPYACTYCSKNFRQRGDRDKHIRARHSNLDENARNILASLKNTGGLVDMNMMNKNNSVSPNPHSKGRLPQSKIPGRSMNFIENDGVVFVGNMPFPASMFKPIIDDIDNSENN